MMSAEIRTQAQRVVARCTIAAQDHSLAAKVNYDAAPPWWPETVEVRFVSSGGWELTLLFGYQMTAAGAIWRCALGSLREHRQMLSPWKYHLLQDLAKRFPRQLELTSDLRKAADQFAPMPANQAVA